MLKKVMTLSDNSHDATTIGDEGAKWTGETWTKAQLMEYAKTEGRCTLVLGGYAVDVTDYLDEHVRPSAKPY